MSVHASPQRGRVIRQQLPESLPTNLRAADLAARWNLSEKTLERWRREGIGPTFLKVGGRVSYPLEEVLAYERRRTRQSTGGSH
jgi:hypothetical protein